ncbi:MAG: hypothetical protein KAG28_00710 [Cocleimonas sp.]|nr:hypothetical protein [Cocleimonas sp.]
MSAEITYGIFILLSLLLLVAWYFLVKKFRSKSKLPSEQFFLLAMGLLFSTFYLIYRGSTYVNNQEYTTASPVMSEKIQAFTLDVYKPLVLSRNKVTNEINSMNVLLDDIDSLVDEHPRHSALLLDVQKIWRKGVVDLQKLDKVIEKEVRHAWIAHDTMNQKTVDAKFSREAVLLDKRIKKGLKRFRKLIIDVHEMLRKDMATIQRKLGKGSPKNKEHSRNITTFNTATSEKLLTFSESLTPEIHVGVVKLLKEISLTEQRQEKVKNYLENNTDLAEPLIAVINEWRKAEKQNRFYFDQILLALESTFLGRKLGIHKNDYAMTSMKKTLQKKIPNILTKAQIQRDKIDNSY